MRLQLLEWAGIGLVATALGLVDYRLGIGAVGLYLFAVAVLAQVMDGGRDGD